MSANKLSQLRDEMKGAKPQRQKSVLQQALDSYFERQGRMAQQGLQMADQGAQAIRGGDLSGIGGALLGPVAYLSSPINALFPERSEVDAATDVPSWSKPFIAGGLETMAIMAPGPKTRGLGRGMASLADVATDAERAALAGRLEAEAAQARPLSLENEIRQGRAVEIDDPQRIAQEYLTYHNGDVAKAIAGLRDERMAWDADAYQQALALLSQRAAAPKKGIVTQSYKETLEDGSTQWVPGTLRVNPPRVDRFQSEMTPADVERYIEQYGVAPAPRKKGEIITQSYKETYPDGTKRWAPGTLRTKRPPKQ